MMILPLFATSDVAFFFCSCAIAIAIAIAVAVFNVSILYTHVSRDYF